MSLHWRIELQMFRCFQPWFSLYRANLSVEQIEQLDFAEDVEDTGLWAHLFRVTGQVIGNR